MVYFHFIHYIYMLYIICMINNFDGIGNKKLHNLHYYYEYCYLLFMWNGKHFKGVHYSKWINSFKTDHHNPVKDIMSF